MSELPVPDADAPTRQPVPTPAVDPRPLCRICGHPLHRFLVEAGLTIHDGHERTQP